MSINYKWRCKNCGKVVIKHLQPHEWWKDENGYRGCWAYDCDRGHEWENIGEAN